MKILFVGDVMLGRTVNAILKHNPPSYPWGNTLAVFKKADLRICNLECVIADTDKPWPGKTFHFQSDPKNVEVLNIARFSPISIANNHTLDFGTKALEQMINILKNQSINFAGAGSDIIEASMPALENGGENYVGMIAFTDNEPDWEAAEKTAGTFFVPLNLEDSRAKMLFDIVKKTRDNVKVLIVSAHWGPNWGYEPPKEHIAFAHALIDAGVDIVYGHSPHVFRGIEIYKGKPILYSTGNFIDDYAVDERERNDRSFIFIVEIEPPEFKKLSLFPTVIRDYQAKLAKEPEAEKIYSKMENLCKSFNTEPLWNQNLRCMEIKGM